MYAQNPLHDLRRLFGGVVEQVFMSELGICTPALTDYLAGLLVDFVHVDDIYRMRNVDGEMIRELSRLRVDADLGQGLSPTERDRVLNRYIGDFTLFWTGVYPETLQARRQLGVDRWREYLLQGKRGYEIAGALSSATDVPPGELLHDLSLHFECCVRGLHLVRQSWDQVARPRQN